MEKSMANVEWTMSPLCERPKLDKVVVQREVPFAPLIGVCLRLGQQFSALGRQGYE